MDIVATPHHFLAWLFGTICNFTERRVFLLSTFLVRNPKYEDFERLQIEDKSWSARGSFVPAFQVRIEILESFLPLVTGSRFLHHRKRIEDEIDSYRRMIDGEKRRHFMSD